MKRPRKSCASDSRNLLSTLGLVDEMSPINMELKTMKEDCCIQTLGSTICVNCNVKFWRTLGRAVSCLHIGVFMILSCSQHPTTCAMEKAAMPSFLLPTPVPLRAVRNSAYS